MLSTTAEVFAEFGPSKYLRRTPPRAIEISKDYALVRSQLRASCPVAPGVYGMIDCADRLVYVGMSRNLRERTQTYFQKSDAHQRKEARIARRARRLLWEPTGHELLALLREQELIRRFMPEMNVRGRRRRSLVFVYVSVEDAPRFRSVRSSPSPADIIGAPSRVMGHCSTPSKSSIGIFNYPIARRTFPCATETSTICLI
jgi:hypothetical protein